MSGRALRRLPVLALARYIGVGGLALPSYSQTTTTATTNASGSGSASKPNDRAHRGADVDMWLDGMEKVVQEQAKELKRLI